MKNAARVAKVIIMALLAVAILSCSDINRQNGPVEMVVSINQAIQRIDLEGNALNCSGSLGVVTLRVISLQGGLSKIPTDNRFNDVKLDSYRVTYVRTDGGHLTPQPFVRSISGILQIGQQPSALSGFLAFPPNAFNQAPFVALQPQNGGRDPETGKTTVQMEIVIEVFGETIAGERVTGSARMPIDFCFHCGGCG
jgi:hypothetical protein